MSWKRYYKIKGKNIDNKGRPVKQYDYGYKRGKSKKHVQVIYWKKT